MCLPANSCVATSRNSDCLLTSVSDGQREDMQKLLMAFMSALQRQFMRGQWSDTVRPRATSEVSVQQHKHGSYVKLLRRPLDLAA